MNGNGGHGMQVVDVPKSHQYVLSEEALGVLNADAARALPVAVVSVAGAFRGGKSFLLDFFLRYLNATDADRNSGAWLGNDEDPLVGFNWSTSYERNTIGIHIWSRLFPMTLNGEKVAVMLMDTQGTFDNDSAMRDNTTIFALSTLLSSLQIYNISGNLKGNDLQHLQYFTEFARLVANDAQPFQHLKFLIRDWQFTDDLPHGADGGRQLLDRVLEVRPDQPADQQEIRRHLRSCFEEIDCFLMAHPGFTVSGRNFNGRLADLRPEFRACLRELVPLVFAPNRLVPKRINGQPLTAQEFVHYLRTYMNAFNSDTLPEPATILQDLKTRFIQMVHFNELNNNGHVSKALDVYVKEMDKGTNGGQPCLSGQELQAKHTAAREAARKFLRQKRNRCTNQSSGNDQYLDRLDKEIKLQYERFTQANKANSESLVLAMISAYKDRVSKLTGGPKMKCLPPSKFHDDDDEIRETINQMYHARRTLHGHQDRNAYAFARKSYKNDAVAIEGDRRVVEA
ncbi:hypothetical protein ABMA28_006746 [Loxostege sticticalis]|uniref:GB1/RHD3-type G domain-containing protein n=1 Tax=Loxostege sticticalis TaxID=481309 RepID=A0ABD0TND6_LOXSC